jgi:Fur family ferric uptake transcriptional regulator/Fur family peroxide stress response transcriptional regulator
MDYLMKHRTHPSIDEIFCALSAEMPTLSRTTVYNTLKLFSDNGAVTMLTIDDRFVNFDADTSFHAHFLCKRCGKIYDLPILPAALDAINMHAEGHLLAETHYYCKGVCRECLEKLDTNNND